MPSDQKKPSDALDPNDHINTPDARKAAEKGGHPVSREMEEIGHKAPAEPASKRAPAGKS